MLDLVCKFDKPLDSNLYFFHKCWHLYNLKCTNCSKEHYKGERQRQRQRGKGERERKRERERERDTCIMAGKAWKIEQQNYSEGNVELKQ